MLIMIIECINLSANSIETFTYRRELSIFIADSKIGKKCTPRTNLVYNCG